MSGLIRAHHGMMPRIHPEAWIAETAVIIGDVEIGAGSSVWYGCVLRADVNLIRVGENTNIQDGTIVHCNHDRSGDDYRATGGGMPTYIGDNITIGHKALLHACRLESGCFIGMGAIVMDEAVIEEGAMVAAGAMVTPGKRVPGGELWAGSPAKFRRPLSEEEKAFMPYSATNYARLARSYDTP